MSAEVLREAAQSMRSKSRFAAANPVADWLDREAEQFEKYGQNIQVVLSWWEYGEPFAGQTPWGFQASTGPSSMRLARIEDISPEPDRHALAVARAYLGVTP